MCVLSLFLALSLILIKNLCLQIYGPLKLLVSSKLSKSVPPPMNKVLHYYRYMFDFVMWLILCIPALLLSYSYFNRKLPMALSAHVRKKLDRKKIRCQLTVITGLNSLSLFPVVKTFSANKCYFTKPRTNYVMCLFAFRSYCNLKKPG